MKVAVIGSVTLSSFPSFNYNRYVQEKLRIYEGFDHLVDMEGSLRLCRMKTCFMKTSLKHPSWSWKNNSRKLSIRSTFPSSSRTKSNRERGGNNEEIEEKRSEKNELKNLSRERTSRPRDEIDKQRVVSKISIPRKFIRRKHRQDKTGRQPRDR